MPPASFRFQLTMDTLAFGYVIPAIRAYSGLPPVRQCSCRAYKTRCTSTQECTTSFFIYIGSFDTPSNRYDMSFDWFRQLYEEEFAQRKKQKQDFTPVEVSEIVAKIALPTVGTIHEPTAGTGGLIISAWWEQCRRAIPWDYYPSQHMISVWELSDRAIPLLLLNLSIRGIMGYVYHGDVLEGTVKARYILLNRSDDALGFSDVVKAEAGDIIVEQCK